MEELSFYDVKTKEKFNSSEYRVEERSGKKFAVTKSPTGDYECWRVISSADADKIAEEIKNKG